MANSKLCVNASHVAVVMPCSNAIMTSQLLAAPAGSFTQATVISAKLVLLAEGALDGGVQDIGTLLDCIALRAFVIGELCFAFETVVRESFQIGPSNRSPATRC